MSESNERARLDTDITFWRWPRKRRRNPKTLSFAFCPNPRVGSMWARLCAAKRSQGTRQVCMHSIKLNTQRACPRRAFLFLRANGAEETHLGGVVCAAPMFQVFSL